MLKTNRRTAVAAAAAAVLVTAAGVWGASALAANQTTLTFQIRDAVSKQWVWDASVTLQGREIRAYYQSDAGLKSYTFTGLQPGTWTLQAAAPHYESKRMEIELQRGANELPDPLELSGYEIPNLARFIVFERFEGGDIISELRPISAAGRAVENHPALDIWVGARVSVQTKEGMPVQESTSSGAERGRELFRGEIEWSWHGEPERVYRYTARIPGPEIASSGAPYWVIDYLILVPDPRKITAGELSGIASAAWRLKSDEMLSSIRAQAGERFDYYFATSWNVAGGRQ